ncbi:MAG: Flp pilus assembly protein CpaB [Gemmatimonadota bacterium]
MRRQAMILLILAVAAGGAAALLAMRVLRTPESNVAQAAETGMTSVAVAARDMNAGTLLGPEDVTMVEWPASHLPAGYSTSAADVLGRGLLQPVRTNEPLLSEKLASVESGGGMPIMIPQGKRAMSVRVDEVVGVAGFVLPGTRVDVVVTMDRTGSSDEAQTRLVLQNIEVVSAGQSLERDPDGNPVEVAVVTVLVAPDQAEQLAISHSNGRLQLALRNPLDMDSVSTPGITASQVIAGRPQPVVRSTAPRPAATTPAPQAPTQLQLEVYRGPERSTSDVDRTLEASGGGGS